MLLIFGGFDTTRNQLGLAMQAFLDHPAQWRLLAERPEPGAGRGRGGHADPPHDHLGHARGVADFTFDGLEITAGTTIHLFCESAGTDPGDAEDAGPGDAVAGSTSRPASGGRTSASAAAIHYCLGHYVARTDMCEALTVLARRLREPRLAGQAAWLPDSGNTGPVRLPIAFLPGQ